VVSGFVQVPNALIEDRMLSAEEVLVWAIVRRSNGEPRDGADLEPCWRSLHTIDARLGACSEHVSGKLKRVMRRLVERGLLVTRRRKRGKTALRWAIRPGLEGDRELRALRTNDLIGVDEWNAVTARRANSGLSGGPEGPPRTADVGPVRPSSHTSHGVIDSPRQDRSGPSVPYDPSDWDKMVWGPLAEALGRRVTKPVTGASGPLEGQGETRASRAEGRS
jgi:hypothetical protein